MHIKAIFNPSILSLFVFSIFFHLSNPVISIGSETLTVSNNSLATEPTYQLFIENSLITLNAKDASLKKVLEDMGRRMNIEVTARIPAQDRVTLQFSDLTLEDALKKFRVNYACITDSKKKQGNITHIVVVPEGQETGLLLKDVQKKQSKAHRRSKNEPFKFEFDPSKYK